MRISLTWDEERTETLKKLWADGLSASKIADKLGFGITRNAVIGKVSRLKLQGRALTQRRTPGPRRVPTNTRPKPVAPARAKPTRQSAWQRHLDSQPVNIEPIVDAPIPLHQRRTVETLEAHHCRWPIGDPQEADFHFCGAKRLKGLPYCECHARRAFNSAPPAEKATPRRSPITNSFVGLHRVNLFEDA